MIGLISGVSGLNGGGEGVVSRTRGLPLVPAGCQLKAGGWGSQHYVFASFACRHREMRSRPMIAKGRRLTSMNSNIIPPTHPRQLRRPRPVRQLPFVLVVMPLPHPSMTPQPLHPEVDAVLLVALGRVALVARLKEGDPVEGHGAVDGPTILDGVWAWGEGAGENGVRLAGATQEVGELDADVVADWEVLGVSVGSLSRWVKPRSGGDLEVEW